MEVREGRSPNYVCSLDPQSCVDMEILNAIKRSVKVMNTDVKWVDLGATWDITRKLKMKTYKRVRVKGREAIEKLNGRSYTWYGDLIGGLSNAKRFDVYIYDDGKYKYV